MLHARTCLSSAHHDPTSRVASQGLEAMMTTPGFTESAKARTRRVGAHHVLCSECVAPRRLERAVRQRMDGRTEIDGVQKQARGEPVHRRCAYNSHLRPQASGPVKKEYQMDEKKGFW